jgi:hypothetical protein
MDGIVLAMLVSLLALTITAQPLVPGISTQKTSAMPMQAATACPLTIGIAQNGALFFDRFNGWYKTTPKTLESVLHAGCYNDSNPQPISSATLALAPGAPKDRKDLVFSILSRQGLRKDMVHIHSWNNFPQRPSR